MNNESQLVLELWELVRDQLPAAKRLETASGILRAFEEYGLESKDLQHIIDEEPYLTRAFYEVFEIEAEDEEDDFSEDDED